MSLLPKDWAFLPDAWKFALVLTGREATATALVSSALDAISKRNDLQEAERIKRVLFSTLCREGTKAERMASPETPAERATFFLHQLPDPSRPAITLLCLRVFSGEHLAALLEKSESKLAQSLGDARERLQPRTTPDP
ncbi:MAG: hypothetical protein IAE94_00760 [Chthoniobacterales bacterium]|nr:hypothetical protein [Chthoniobacterales bacterium]